MINYWLIDMYSLLYDFIYFVSSNFSVSKVFFSQTTLYKYHIILHVNFITLFVRVGINCFITVDIFYCGQNFLIKASETCRSSSVIRWLTCTLNLLRWALKAESCYGIHLHVSLVTGVWVIFKIVCASVWEIQTYTCL